MVSPLRPENWSRRVLGIEPDASADCVRRVAFDRLRESSFLPPPVWDEALRIATVSPAARPAARHPAYHAARRSALKAEIQAFAENGIRQASGQRAEQHARLLDAAASEPELRWRLQTLSSAVRLDDAPANLENPRVAELIEALRAIIAAPLAEQPELRRELLSRAARSDAAGWRKAAEQLKSANSPWAGLQPKLIAELAADPKKRTLRRPRLQKPPAPVLVSEGGRTPWLLAVILVVGVIRLIFSLGGTAPGLRESRPIDPPLRSSASPTNGSNPWSVRKDQTAPGSSQPTLGQRPGPERPRDFPLPSDLMLAANPIELIPAIADETSLALPLRQELARDYLKTWSNKYSESAAKARMDGEIRSFADTGIVTPLLKSVAQSLRERKQGSPSNRKNRPANGPLNPPAENR